MKLIITVFFSLLTYTFCAQNNFQGKAIYKSKRTLDMSRFNKMPEQRKKQMLARMKNHLEKTYTLLFKRTSSIFKEDVQLAAPSSGSGSHWGRSTGKGAIYKDLKSKILIEDIEQFGKRFLISDSLQQNKWQMTAETKKIGNYTCYKATMVTVDRAIDWRSIFRPKKNKVKDSTQTVSKKNDIKLLKVTVWYTPQIPISNGPDVYWGLPGLILELNAGRTTMLCTELVLNTKENMVVKQPKKGKKVTREDYNKIVKIKTAELKELFKNRKRNRIIVH